MQYRTVGKTGVKISEIGFGCGNNAVLMVKAPYEDQLRAVRHALDQGITFFDTAFAYGDGHSETLLGELLKRHPDKRLYAATKIPPKNRRWPARPEFALDEVFPADYIREMTERSLTNLGVSAIDLQQFHVWTDEWARDDRWQRAVRALKDEGLIRAFGISINRWQPANVLQALATGLIDAVQVVYNVFDQAPEDELFPECQRRNIAVIARVPFDEGSLTGTLTTSSTWPEGDFRNIYFNPENLANTVEHVARLKPLVPAGMDLPELALRFILEHPAVSTTIPGMRKPRHVERNIAVSDGERLSARLRDALRAHRWDRMLDIP
jgi:aryl-alcohol dehydrogenase-like predicted oxidoreductase